MSVELYSSIQLTFEGGQGFEHIFAGDLVSRRVADALPSDVAVGVDDKNGS